MALYSDLDISFTKDPRTRDLTLRTDADAVKQSVMNLLYTNFYERPFQPPLGSGVLSRLFEPNDEITQFIMADDIRRVLERFEPRVTIKFVDFYKENQPGPNGAYVDANEVLIEVGFVVQNVPTIQTAQIVLQRLR